MRRGPAAAVLLGSLVALAGCQDLRDFTGTWSGPRVGGEHVRQGFGSGASATLEINGIDLDGINARLSTNDDRFGGATIVAVPGAEADVLTTMTFDGSPLRVFIAFAEARDGGGAATAFISLYSDDRIEMRLLRGGDNPLYGIFALAPTGD